MDADVQSTGLEIEVEQVHDPPTQRPLHGQAVHRGVAAALGVVPLLLRFLDQSVSGPGKIHSSAAVMVT